MEAARAALSAAGERQQRLDALIAEEQAKLDAINANRASRGSGRPPGAEARRVAAIERKLDRLKRGELPDDAGAGAAPRADVDLRASARQHPQHHAAAGVAPQGRSSNSTGGGSSSGVGSGGADGDPDQDDDEESEEFKQYYRVSSNQRVWNETVAHEYSNGLRDRGAIEVEPPNVLRSLGCGGGHDATAADRYGGGSDSGAPWAAPGSGGTDGVGAGAARGDGGGGGGCDRRRWRHRRRW